MKNIFVVIDGVDGSGKTSACKFIEKELGFCYYKSPGGIFAELSKRLNPSIGAIDKYEFFYRATQNDSIIIKEQLKTSSVICDRFYPSTYSYHVAMNHDIDAIYRKSGQIGILQPDFIFILTANFEIRNKRIVERAKNSNIKENISLDHLNYLNNVDKVFQSLGFPIIDTSNLTVKMVAQNIIDSFKNKTPR